MIVSYLQRAAGEWEEEKREHGEREGADRAREEGTDDETIPDPGADQENRAGWDLDYFYCFTQTFMEDNYY